MDNDYNSNDYYQSSSESTGNKYSLNKSSEDVNLNGAQNQSQSPYGGQNPYGGQQNPYGGQSPYGGQQNPYGGNPYGGQNGGSPYGGAYYQNPASIRASVAMPVSSVDVNDVLVKSFLFMFLALLVTGISSLAAFNSNFLFGGDPSTLVVKIIVCFIAELALVFAAQAAMKKNNVTVSAICFFGYAVVNGLTLSVIFYAYARADITKAFFMTAIVFGLMAGIGYFTKLDLTKLGNILMIGLIGIILCSLVNMFLRSEAFDYALTIIGIILFMGLTAYDIQKIKKLATGNSYLDPLVIGLYGALELYLDFINLFIRLLRIMGRARR